MSGIKLRPIVFKVVQPPYVLLDEKAVESYTTDSARMYTPPTFTTDKDFICYKMSVHPTSDASYYGGAVNVSTNVNSKNYGWYWSGIEGNNQRIYTYSNTPTALSAGTDGTASYDGDANQAYCRPTQSIPASTTEFTTLKFVFQISARKAYFYIDGKQIAICNNWTTDWNPLEANVTGQWRSMQTFGIQVYACDSLEAALEC